MKHNRFWIWLIVTILLDVCQFAVFDCNSMPVLSLAFGAIFFGIVVGVPMKWFDLYWNESLSRGKKIAYALAVALLGIGIGVVAGVCLLFTHLCS